MLHIKCPHCGLRSQNEFSYGGDASVKRPELNKEISNKDWDNFVYNRKKFKRQTSGSYGNIYQDVDSGLKLKETLQLMKYFRYNESK